MRADLGVGSPPDGTTAVPDLSRPVGNAHRAAAAAAAGLAGGRSAVGQARVHVAAAIRALTAPYLPPAADAGSQDEPAPPVIVQAARRRLGDAASTLEVALGLLDDYRRTLPPSAAGHSSERQP